MTSDPRLVRRVCPMCGDDKAQTILDVPLKSFARTNKSYKQDVVDTFGFADTDTFPIVACKGCGFQYVQDRLNDELMIRLYRDVIDHDISWQKIFKTEKRRILTRYWLDILGCLSMAGMNLENLKVLDFGCGWGDFLDVASGSGIETFGLEPDMVKATFAKKNGHKILADVPSILEAGPFDVIVSNAVWEHVLDPRDAAQTFFKALKPGAIGLVTVPNCEWRRVRMMQHRLTDGDVVSGEFNPWEHINYFSHDTLRTCIEMAGLEVIRPQEDTILPLARLIYDAARVLKVSGLVDRIRPVGPIVYPTRIFVQHPDNQ